MWKGEGAPPLEGLTGEEASDSVLKEVLERGSPALTLSMPWVSSDPAGSPSEGQPPLGEHTARMRQLLATTWCSCPEHLHCFSGCPEPLSQTRVFWSTRKIFLAWFVPSDVRNAIFCHPPMPKLRFSSSCLLLIPEEKNPCHWEAELFVYNLWNSWVPSKWKELLK